MTSNENTLLVSKCLGRALGKEILYLASVRVKFYSEKNKDITSKILKDSTAKNDCFMCFGHDMIYLVKEDLSLVIEKLSYNGIAKIELDGKKNDCINLHVNVYSEMYDTDIAKIKIFTINRNHLQKKLVCYSTVFFENYENEIKEVPFYDPGKSERKENKQKMLDEKGGKDTKFFEATVKHYKFYLKGIVKTLFEGKEYEIKYQAENPNNKKIDKKEEQYFCDKCLLSIEIGDELPCCLFESDQNLKDISLQANKTILNYLKNTYKSSNFWILKNEPFHKKLNFNEDTSIWEGWRIDIRNCEPTYENIIFIYLRRKYIPPFFDSFQNFTFMLRENFSLKNYEPNPEGNRVINLAVNSLNKELSSSVNDNKIFLKAKFDALLCDEDMLYYLQNVCDIQGEDIYKFGYALLYNIYAYYQRTNANEKVDYILSVIKAKKKNYHPYDELWEHEGNYYDFMKEVKKYICEVIGARSEQDDDSEHDENMELISETPNYDTPMGLETLIKTKKSLEINTNDPENFRRIWTDKLMKFIGFALCGGLIDYKITYPKFKREILDACQKTNNDIKDLCFHTINFRDDSNFNKSQFFLPKSELLSLADYSKVKFNHDILCECIRSNFLQKYLEGYKELSMLLMEHHTNRLLKAVYEDLKYIDDPNNVGERTNVVSLITPLREIFEDHKMDPSTILLAGKSLIFLVKNDKVNRIKLSYEGNMLRTIKDYLIEYNYNQELILCCLELFSFIISETKENLQNILYAKNGSGIIDQLMKFLGKPNIPGVYYSQRIMIKVVTCLLNLTTNFQANCREMLNNEYLSIYDSLINFLVPEKRCKIVDPSEEESSILDFKVYYMLMILTSKNDIAQDHLFTDEKYDFKNVIENNSERYLKQMVSLVGLKDKASKSDLKVIGKKIYKFMELVYFLIINNEDRRNEVWKEYDNFMKLFEYCKSNLSNLLSNESDMKSNVIGMLTKIFAKAQDDNP